MPRRPQKCAQVSDDSQLALFGQPDIDLDDDYPVIQAARASAPTLSSEAQQSASEAPLSAGPVASVTSSSRMVPPAGQERAPFSLDAAREWLQERIEDGVRCPCCDQYAKVYERKLNSGMAVALIAIYVVSERLRPQDGWLSIPRDLEGVGRSLATVLTNREYPKLRFWGLLEPSPKAAAVWRITDEGKRFVRGEITVPRTVRLYDGEVLESEAHGYSTIRDALADKFDYEELMGKRDGASLSSVEGPAGNTARKAQENDDEEQQDGR